MTREEIRKKWKNKEFVEAEGSKIQLHNNETNKFNSQNLSLKNRVNDRVANVMKNNPVSFKDRVEARAQNIMNRSSQLANIGNPILEYGKTRQNKYNEYKNMKRITGKDLGMFAKNLALGGYNGGVSAVRQNEYLSQQRSEGYRTFNQIQTRVNEQMKNKTADEKLKYNIEQLNKSKSVNGVLVQEQMKINDTSTMKMYNAEEERINKKIAKNAENTDTVAGKYLAGEIAPSMGQSLVGTGLDIIAPGMGSAYRMLSYSGNYTQDGLLKGMTEDNAAMYGLTMAGVETVMDTIGDKMKGIAIGEAKTVKGLKETIKITAKELGINSFFEGSGEALTEPLQELIASLYGGTADYENISSRMVQSFLAGAVSELLMTGSSLGYGSSINAMNKIKNGEQVSTKEIASALKEINQKEEVDIKNILKDNLNFAEQSLIQSNSKQIDKKTSNKLENIATQLSNEESVNVVNILKKEKEDIINNSNLTDVQKQKLMEITNKYDLGKGDIKDLINKTSMLEKEQVKTSNKDISQVNQQVIPQEQNQAQNTNMKQSEATQQKSEKYNKFKQQLAENGLNYDDKRANVMFDLPNKRGIDVEVDAEVFKKADRSINSNINAMYITDAEGNRKIVYNPNANLDTVIEKNTIHEVVHDMEGTKEYKQLSKMVLDKMENTPEFQEAYNGLKEAYSKVTDSEGRILYNKDSEDFDNMIKQEAVADYLGENLGNQEYINELVNGKETKNIAQKIYDAIINFLDKVTGYKSEEAYLRGLKNKFEKAFNAEHTDLGENNKYSILTNSKNQKYVKADRQVINGNNPREWQKQTRNYINEKIRSGKNVNVITDSGDVLTITRDTAGKAQFRNEVLRADGTRSTLSNEELLTKLTAETHIDELAKISTKTNKLPIPDTKNHKFAKDGFDYRRAYFEDFDGQYYKITMSVGKNGNINTIYNIGRLDNLSKKNRSKFSVTAQRPLSQMTNKENLSSINSITNSNENVNTTKYSMQENKNNSENSNKSSFSLDKKENILINTKGNEIDISNIQETSQMKLNTYNRKYDRNSIIAYRGVSEDTGNNAAMYGLGLYTTLDKKYASKYGEVKVVDNNLLPDNPLKFKTQNDFQMWEQDLASQLGIRRSELLGSNYGIEKYVTKLGYDGLMIGTGRDTDLISFKNIDNVNPDIRYSQNDNDKWQEFLDKNSMNDGTKTALGDLKMSKEQDTNITSNAQDTQTNYTAPAKARQYEHRQRSIFKKNMSNMLGISQFNQNNKALFDTALDQLRAEYNQRGSISKEVRNDIFNNLYNNLLIEDKAFYETNKELKDNIRTTKLYIDNKTKVSIVDYDDFRKSAIGSAVLTNEKGNVPIDSYYQELNELNPDLFPIDITNTADQLKRIVEVSKSIRKAERNVAEYNDIYMAKEYKQYAQQEFNSYVDKLANEYKTVDRYTQDRIKQSQKEEYVKPELQEVRNYYENRNLLQKEIEKQEKNLLLTQREKAVVDRLLKDEMDVNEILPGLNKEAIIKSYRARQQLDYLKQSIKEYKAQVKQDLKDVADSLTVDAETWKDKSWGLWYARETATRNMQDIMSKESAERVNKELFEPIIHNTAEQTRFLNEYSDTIEKLDLDKKEKYDWKDSAGNDIKIDEATVAQLLIEKEIDDTYLRNNGLDANRIKTIANTFEKLLKDTVSQMDDVYIQFGYAPVEKRKNYFPHFMENQPDTFMSKFANAFGFKVGQEDLPTDIAGRTETFKPGRAFDRNILRRTTNKTDYNALKALDMYMQGASDIIYHTEDIQKLRAFNESIRDRFRTSEIQKKLDAINENPEYTAEERVAERQKIIDAQKTPLNNLVTWVDEYTNVLANKKSSADRQLEKDTSRQAYTTMKDIEGKIASNLIGGNFSVALTNFAPLSQAMGTTKTGNILIGMLQTTQNNISEMLKGEGDSFVNESDFLTSRRGNDLTQKETFAQKFSNTVSTPMELIDNFTSESIVRAKYRENIKNGMDHSEALKNADIYARNLMADRSKGAMPTVFSRTNPVTKLITAFQVEPNNIISNYFKDMPRDSKIDQQNLAYQMTKLSVASYAFNTVLKGIRGGGDVIPNPIGIVSQLVALAMHNLDDDDEIDEKVSEVLGNIANDILGCIPGGSAIATGLVALGIDELQDNGKLMVSSAMPDFTKVTKLFDHNVSNDYKKQVIANELTKPLLYLGLPTGGAQLSKTTKGLYSYVQGGSYSYDKEGKKSLQFPVERTPINAIKSTVFGKYSLSQAQNYLENNFDGMNDKETSLYEQTGIDFYELKEYFSKSKNASKSEKMEYAENMNVSIDNQWELYKYNIFSSSERDDGTSQVTDAEYAIKNKLASKKEYMELFREAEQNNISFPNGEKLQELNDSSLNLSTYMKYQTEVKKATNEKKKKMLPVSDESKVLSDKDKINLIQNNVYTEEEKRTIYSNYIKKDDEVYNVLSKIQDGETNIEAYLEYKLQDFEGDEDKDSNIVGKKVTKGSGSSKNKTLEYINSSKFSDLEKLYLVETKYPNVLNNKQKESLKSLVESKITNEEELGDILKKFKDLEQHKDGKWYWK